MKPSLLTALCAGVLFGVPFACATSSAVDPGAAMPRPPREFRAAWVATVANIDWPSRRGLPPAQQQEEAVAILDRCRALHFNAVILQVRPHADALYPSTLEPWSVYLCGTPDQAPEPFYDPLAFWVEEAHARGLQLHAWFNPYRASHPSQKSPPSPRSVIRAHPEWVHTLGSKGYVWMDPSLPAVQDRTVEVILDVVRRYRIDGVHLDDYFYPYASYNDGADFPDGASFAAYRARGGTLDRGDWRRAAVDGLIARLYREIKSADARVEFGISPFGIWRPGHPPGIAGLDQYAVLFADARRWWREGWVDYLSPQLYWPIGRIPQSFPVLLGWWQRENRHGRHLWPGTIFRSEQSGGEGELIDQVMITRGMLPDSPGMCYFSMRGLMPVAEAEAGAETAAGGEAGARRPDSVAARLRAGPYRAPALVPASPWLDAVPPPAPRVAVAKTVSGLRIEWTIPAGEDVGWFVVYRYVDGTWRHEILPGDRRAFSLRSGEHPVTRIAVSAVDRSRNESVRVPVRLDRPVR